jgi:hypothetical protein
MTAAHKTLPFVTLVRVTHLHSGRPVIEPVRPFIWPQYHDVMRGPLAGTYISYDYWMLQLTTIRDAGVSGIIFWGGYKDTMG